MPGSKPEDDSTLVQRADRSQCYWSKIRFRLPFIKMATASDLFVHPHFAGGLPQTQRGGARKLPTYRQCELGQVCDLYSGRPDDEDRAFKEELTCTSTNATRV